MSNELPVKTHAESGAAQSPIETLTSLVLDAADAANDSAQSTQEAISRLAQVVETNQETTRAVRNAPAIFGAIMLSVGIVMAVVVAMVFSRLNARAEALNAAIVAQAEGLEKLEASLKELSVLESNLEKFKTVAEDTTQRAVITLREQVKADRIALQALEVRRLNEMLASLRGAVGEAPRSGPGRQGTEGSRLSAQEKSKEEFGNGMSRIESRLVALEKSVAGVESGIARIEAPLAAAKQGNEGAAAKRPVAVLSDAQAKDMKATVAEVVRLKAEIAALRELIERRNSQLQSGVPAINKSGS